MGIPTLVLAGERSAAGVEGNRLGAVALDPNDVAGIACLLEQLWRDDSQQRSPCPASITYDAIAARVDTLLRGNGAAPQLPRGGRNRRTSGLAARPRLRRSARPSGGGLRKRAPHLPPGGTRAPPPGCGGTKVGGRP